MLYTLSEAFFENEEAVEFTRTMMLSDPNPQPPEAFARQLEASRRHDARDRLGTLDMPVHVIGCEYDILVPIWKQQELVDLIPDAKLTVVDRCPHGANLERAPEFNQHVLDFIAEHAAAPSDGRAPAPAGAGGRGCGWSRSARHLTGTRSSPASTTAATRTSGTTSYGPFEQPEWDRWFAEAEASTDPLFFAVVAEGVPRVRRATCGSSRSTA